MRLISTAVTLVALLSACSLPLAGAELPPASMPEEFESGVWAIAFAHDLEPGFWAEGNRTYVLLVECEPSVMEHRVWSQRTFDSTTDVAVIDERVLLRLSGLSVFQTGPPTIDAINPAQATTAMVTIVGLSQERAVSAVDSCVGEMTYVGEGSFPLSPGVPFRP